MATSAPKVGLLLRAWNEMPEVVGATFMALVGIGFGAAGLYLYDKREVDRRKYKVTYVVYRPGDPRIATIKKRSGLDS